MLYGVQIGGAYNNTLTEYGLCLLDDLKIEAPQLKSNYVDIPGADGEVNLSYAPQGYPVYQNRTITFTLFKGVDDVTLELIRQELIDAYQGKEVDLLFPIDNYTYSYHGVIHFGGIDGYNSGKIPVTLYAKPTRSRERTVTMHPQQHSWHDGITISYAGRPTRLYVDTVSGATVSASNQRFSVTAAMPEREDITTPEFNVVPNFYVVNTTDVDVTSYGDVTLRWMEEIL